MTDKETEAQRWPDFLKLVVELLLVSIGIGPRTHFFKLVASEVVLDLGYTLDSPGGS